MGDAEGALGDADTLFGLILAVLLPAERFKERRQVFHREVFRLRRGRILNQEFLGCHTKDVGKPGFILREYLVKDADDFAFQVSDGINQIAAEARECAQRLDIFI